MSNLITQFEAKATYLYTRLSLVITSTIYEDSLKRRSHCICPETTEKCLGIKAQKPVLNQNKYTRTWRSALLANSSRYPATPIEFVDVALGVYVLVLYNALRQAGVIVVEQLEGTVAKEVGSVNSPATAISSSIALISSCTKCVALMLRIVPK